MLTARMARSGLIVVELEQRWQLDDAGLAPGGPEVDQHHLAAIVGQMNGGGAVGDGEIWGRLAGLAGCAPRLQADRGQREQEERE